MPELPEVETTRRGIEPHVVGRRVTRVIVRDRRLRWPVPERLSRELPGQTIRSVSRRAKYIVLHADHGAVVLHLGMSGQLRVLSTRAAVRPHDHVDVVIAGGTCLRLNDPRRFGSVHWTRNDPLEHPLLVDLGVEPLAPEFDGAYLRRIARRRSLGVKSFIMDAKVVVGVGNIYASEALFEAGIHPRRAVNRIGEARYERLADAIRGVLSAAIRSGGTTIRDYQGTGGDPGAFGERLRVYGREGEPCVRCGREIRRVVIGQRATYYCPDCQV